MNVPGLSAVDLFCGCGGLSEGIRSAGFAVVAGVDVDPRFLSTFSMNFPEARAHALDLAKTTPKVLAQTLGVEPGSLTLLAGGPPCQGFSKNVPRKQRFLQDPRNALVSAFLDIAEYLRPAAVLFENVAEMANGFERAYSDEVADRLTSAGYLVAHKVLNAADYGVPQRRRRAFFVATRTETLFSFPGPSHRPPGSPPELFPTPEHVSVWDAISDLPSLQHGTGLPEASYSGDPETPYQVSARNGCHILRNHVARPLRPTQFARLSSLKPGEGLKQLPKALQTKGGYSGAYGRLRKQDIAPTITRWVFHPGSGKWGHPVDIRTLSIREIARIQGFPDRFVFAGSFTECSAQLGNAVPPLLATVISSAIRQHLQRAASRSRTKPSTSRRSSSLGL